MYDKILVPLDGSGFSECSLAHAKAIARDNSIDLIIMSTHGRSGVTRWALGSVAERVLRHSPTAVRTSSPKECRVA